jgi:hypothetical protein
VNTYKAQALDSKKSTAMADRSKVTAGNLALNISRAIEQKTWENNQLRQELEYERQKY